MTQGCRNSSRTPAGGQPRSGWVGGAPGALPARFRRVRVLIVGCGDVGTRVLRLVRRGVAVSVTTAGPARVAELRALGARPLVADLDQPAMLRRLAGLADRVVHLAPPAREGESDRRTRALVQALARRSVPQALAYVSTSGVYGDCGGAWVDETRMPDARTARAARRVDAEHAVRRFGLQFGVTVTVLRAPGIYALDREGGTPRERLLRRLPVLSHHEDVYTNHIHADDLARACLAALWRGRPGRVYNASDDSRLKMGDYFDQAADLFALERPPRMARDAIREQLTQVQLSFMSESRRLRNDRLKKELRLRLRYPTVLQGLRTD